MYVCHCMYNLQSVDRHLYDVPESLYRTEIASAILYLFVLASHNNCTSFYFYYYYVVGDMKVRSKLGLEENNNIPIHCLCITYPVNSSGITARFLSYTLTPLALRHSV